MLSGAVLLFLYFPHILAFETSVPRIIGGKPSAERQFPFAVAVFYERNNNVSLCGGSLINTRWVLTAGHCVLDSTRFNIHIGRTDLEKPSSNGVIVDSTEYIVHPNYTPSHSLDNNIGLIRLPKAVTFSSTIQAINLPNVSLASSQSVTVLGWGVTGDSASYANILHNVSLSTISNSECIRLLGGNIITNNMVCALGPINEGTCRGDSGGPLVQSDAAGKIIQVGIANFFVANRCEMNYPSGFTRTFEYIEWITNITQSDASCVLVKGNRLLLIAITFIGVLSLL